MGGWANKGTTVPSPREAQLLEEIRKAEQLGEAVTGVRLAQLMFIRHGVRSTTYDLLNTLYKKGWVDYNPDTKEWYTLK